MPNADPCLQFSVDIKVRCAFVAFAYRFAMQRRCGHLARRRRSVPCHMMSTWRLSCRSCNATSRARGARIGGGRSKCVFAKMTRSAAGAAGLTGDGRWSNPARRCAQLPNDATVLHCTRGDGGQGTSPCCGSSLRRSVLVYRRCVRARCIP